MTRVEVVEWNDSGMQGDVGWKKAETFAAAMTVDKMLAHTVGFVMHEDEDVLLLGQTYDAAHDAYCGAMAILKRDILRRETLFNGEPE